MALQECGLNLNRFSKELQPHGSIEFPCAGYSSFCTERPEDNIPWHWHEEMEIAYVEHGQAIVKIPSASFLLNKGDLVIVNSNVLHYGAAVSECRLHSLVFHPLLITGNNDSVFAAKYIRPLLSCCSFSGYQICGQDRESAASWFCNAFEALANESFGFEFTVRENLSRICLYLYRKFEGQLDIKTSGLSQDHLRIRQMLDYIHKNFGEMITLSEISAAVGISKRECLRCFQKTLQLSPIQYLLKYRIMQGAEMLLENPGSSVSEIAARCGFDSPSNFSKVFKRFYHCTPREYRNRKIPMT